MKKCIYSKEDISFVREDGNMVAKWWPNRLNLKILQQNNEKLRPDIGINYKEEFKKLDLDVLIEDLKVLMKTSQDWWPADWGHYGPLFIRLSWHSAGTYRLVDGKGGANGGNQRFAPVNSWPDNANLDKARRLLWPIKKKYGNKISWADLMILAGNVALEDMGFKVLGFAGGREDIWEAEIDTYWGSEEKWLEDKRRTEKGLIKNSLAAAQMGLIYVNPEGPNGVPDVLGAAKEIRDSFRRMGMNDEETIALIAGGHTFGKNHGAADPKKYLGPEPESAPVEEMGLGWKNSFRSGKGEDTITSGIEGAWTPTPTKWDDSFLRILFKYEWNLQKSPAGAWQWVAINPDEKDMVVDAHNPNKKSPPVMLTTDLALKQDPEFAKISKKFLENHKYFEEAFAKAWFKLTHRDLGPKRKYLGNKIPKEDFIWQDIIPKENYSQVSDNEIKEIKNEIKQKIIQDISLTKAFIYTAWVSANSFRRSDFKGGVNGAYIDLEPQKNWEINTTKVNKALNILKEIKKDKKISLADLIVLSANTAIEFLAKKEGIDVEVPFKAKRGDTIQELVDVHSWQFLEPVADGFINYISSSCDLEEDETLLFMADKLGLNVREMVVLVGGLRSLGVSFDEKIGVLTNKFGNSFFEEITSMDIKWEVQEGKRKLYKGIDKKTNEIKYIATKADLIFGANSELRAQSEFYAQDDNKERFIEDFIKAWNKVMENDIY